MYIVHIQKQEKTKLNVFAFQPPFHLDVHQEQRNHWPLQRMHDRAVCVHVCAGAVCVNTANLATVPKGPDTALRFLILMQHFSRAKKCGRAFHEQGE